MQLPYDSGRIRLEAYRGLLYCEAYMDDEFTITELELMTEAIQQHFDGFSDVILKKVGNYSVSADLQIRLSRGVREIRNFVYVADSRVKKESALFASSTYMSHYNAKVADSREEAYSMLVDQVI